VTRVGLEAVDLFFRAKIEATLAAAGHEVVAVGASAPAELVIADVNRCEPEDVLARHPSVPVLGFGQHTDAAGLRRARAAGFARVVPRSVLATRLPALVEELTGAGSAPSASG
jgi:hypothetical protein